MQKLKTLALALLIFLALGYVGHLDQQTAQLEAQAPAQSQY